MLDARAGFLVDIRRRNELIPFAMLGALALGACGNDSTAPVGSGAGGGAGASASQAGSTGSATTSGTAAGGGGAGGGPCAPIPGCDTTNVPSGGTCDSAGLVDCSHAAIACCIPAAQQNDPACNCFSKCAAADTPIATPSGEQAIAMLRPGNLVYSVSDGAIIAVPILRVQRVEVTDHEMVRASFGGIALEMSPGHPSGDGRTFGQLVAGDALLDAVVTSVERVRIDRGATYDILPASESGTYFAGGVLVGSTLFDRSAPHPR